MLITDPGEPVVNVFFAPSSLHSPPRVHPWRQVLQIRSPVNMSCESKENVFSAPWAIHGPLPRPSLALVAAYTFTLNSTSLISAPIMSLRAPPWLCCVPLITTEGTENTEKNRIKVYFLLKTSVHSVYSVVQSRIQTGI